MKCERSENVPKSYKQIAEKAFITSDALLDDVKSLKPHMLEVCKNLLETAPVSLYLYIESLKLKTSNPSTAFSSPTVSETKITLPKKHAIIFEEQDEQNSLLLSALDRTESFADGVRLDTSQTEGEDFYTLNIFWKKTLIDLGQIESPILAFLIKGMDYLYEYNSSLLLDLQQKFLKMNLNPILYGKYIEDSEELSLFREQPILPKKLLLDFIEKLEKSSTLELLEKFSVVKDILQIWMITLLCEQNQGVLPEGDDLFMKMGKLFKLETVRIKKSFRYVKNGKRFQITKMPNGHKLQPDV